MDNNHKQFIEQIVLNSESKNYDDAIKEWHFLYEEFGGNKCICGHIIKFNYHIKNIINHKRLIVGSVCIKRLINNVPLKIEFNQYTTTKKDFIKLYNKKIRDYEKKM